MNSRRKIGFIRRCTIIEGACSNQVVKCIIYSNNVDVAIKKLLEIEKEKIDDDINVTKRCISRKRPWIRQEIQFSDGEEWIVVRPNDNARGYRWRKAWIDASNVSVSDLEIRILPYGNLYKWEDEKYFNW